ncbi:neuronal acetylcholine receptor subunit alpha-6 [Elysia marginata]|uniref:Neuronal acetylcholine receptor subunit alpha-6 n=1 Tax=Elysia marginata TaxID=1093978 RepID=A0AAV4HQV1_9GAST|nr:neuronal acetylcholine receptor subunit alpha-6 [Elysia marginata]
MTVFFFLTSPVRAACLLAASEQWSVANETGLRAGLLAGYNSNTDLSAIDEDTIPARVNYEGQVSWQPPAILSMSCDMDSTFFPFDRQTCSIQVGGLGKVRVNCFQRQLQHAMVGNRDPRPPDLESDALTAPPRCPSPYACLFKSCPQLTSFGYTMNEVSIMTEEGVRMDFYTENGDWDIKSMKTTRSVFYDGGFPYSMVKLSLEAKRRSTFHWINIIIPILVNSFLCCFVFLLPADSGEKMGYSLTCLLAFVVLLTLLAADMPTSAKHTSLLVVVVVVIVVVVVVEVVVEVEVEEVEVEVGVEVEVVVVVLVLNLHFHFKDDEIHPVKGRALKWTKFAMLLLRDKRLKKADGKVHPAYHTESGRPPSYESEERPPTKTPVHRMSSASGNNEDEDDLKVTWKIVAEVIDGVCLRIYTTFIGLLTFVFLLAMVLGDA